MISHNEAQELHEAIGYVLLLDSLDDDSRRSLERALALASIVVSDTDPEEELWVSRFPIQTIVTFGQQYARVTHPTFPEAHPDALLVVAAEDYPAARLLLTEFLQGKFSTDYPIGPDLEERLVPDLYPRGVTHVLDVDGCRELSA